LWTTIGPAKNALTDDESVKGEADRRPPSYVADLSQFDLSVGTLHTFKDNERSSKTNDQTSFGEKSYQPGPPHISL
jgi:hypothetical protein